jgi:hypothetical protein
MAVDILPLRAYARTKQAYDEHNERGGTADKLPALPLIDDVMCNDFELHGAKRTEEGA